MADIIHINKRLKQAYGRNLAGMALFRISFSDDQLEKRFGSFAEYYGKIFLREFHGLREVPKYTYLKGRYILERWIPPIFAHNPEIPETSRGSYEPVYVFQDAMCNALEPVEEVAQHVIWNLLHPTLPGHRKSLLETEDQLAIEKEIEFHKMVLEEAGRSWIGHRLHSKEAIIRP